MKKALSPILASVVAAVLAVSSMAVSMPINAHAEDGTPSVTAFATADDLRNANNFTLHTDNGSGVARKVYFGKNSTSGTVKTWYIAGADSDGSLILMCDPANPLGSQVFNATKETTYANSGIRNYLKLDGLNNHFTTEEKGLMKNPTLYTDGSDSTSDELYLASGINDAEFLTVGRNGTKIGLYRNGPSDSPYTNDSNTVFWLRDKADSWWYCALCAYPGSDYSVKTYDEDHELNVVPAFNLDMTNVLFASTAKPATSGSDMGDAMTFRMKNNEQFASSVTKEGQTISVTYDSGDGDVYLYVQGRNDGDWVVAKKITGSSDYDLSDIGAPSGTDLSKCEVWLEKTDNGVTYAEWIPIPKADAPKGETYSAPGHVHKYEWQIITEPTKDTDGLEGEMCSCGATRNTQKLSAYAYALYQYAMPMINNAKPGQTITFEFGEWNSFPKLFMEKIAAKSAEGVTFVFHYKWNHEKQEITIPFGTAVDTQFDWYGPAKLAELYGMN